MHILSCPSDNRFFSQAFSSLSPIIFALHSVPVLVLIQCAEEGHGSSEDPAFVPPRLLSGSEMKALLQWEESESHPIPALEKQIAV